MRRFCIRCLIAVLVLAVVEPAKADEASKLIVVNGGTIRIDSATAASEVEQLRAKLAETEAKVAEQAQLIEEQQVVIRSLNADQGVLANYLLRSSDLIKQDLLQAGKLLGDDLALDQGRKSQATLNKLASALAKLTKTSLDHRLKLFGDTSRRLEATVEK